MKKKPTLINLKLSDWMKYNCHSRIIKQTCETLLATSWHPKKCGSQVVLSVSPLHYAI